MNNNNSDAKEFLKKLSSLRCVSGYELDSPAAAAIREEFSKYCGDVKTDRLGNIIARKDGSPKDGGRKIKILFAAHMDEIGLMVTGVNKQGLVTFTTLGGFDARTLPCREVIIKTRLGAEIYGVIGAVPPHMIDKDKKDKASKIEDMGVDTGYTKDEIEKLVTVGDTIIVKREPVELQNNCLAGKSLDNFAGVTALREAMRSLADYRHDAELYFAATSREESGRTGGAFTAAYSIEPDIAVAVDAGYARAPEIAEQDSFEMGKGPAIAIGPNINGKVFETLKTAAANNDIPYQIEVCPMDSGTDASDMQIAGNGAATGLISIPVRNMHTAVETIKFDDVVSAARLIKAFVTELNGSRSDWR